MLNFALTFHNVWPTLWIVVRHELSIEIAVLLAGLVLLAAWRRPPAPRFAAALAGVLLVMTIGRYAEVTAPALYGRPINLYWDAQHIPNVVAMLAKVADPWLLVSGAVALLAALAGVPLTAGFIGKFFVFSLAVEAKLWWGVGIAFIAAAAGFYYYLTTVRAMWWSVPGEMKPVALPAISKVCVAALTVATLVFGIWPQPILALLK